MADLGAGAIFGAINTAFKFSEFVIALNEVGTENHVFVRTIQRVREDLEETERLLYLPAIRSNLLSNPEKSLWIKKAIYSTKCALNDIGLYVERVRSEHDRDGDISFKNRVRWVLNDHGKLENRRSELTACHQTLTTVLISLHHIEMIAGFAAPAPPSDPQPPTYGEALAFEDFKSPYQRKKTKGKAPLVAATETTEVYNADVPIPPVPKPAVQQWPLPQQEPKVHFPQNSCAKESAIRPSQQDVKSPNGPCSEEVHSIAQSPPPAYHNLHSPRITQVQEKPKPVSSPVIPPPLPPIAPYQERTFSGNNSFGPVNPWNWTELPAEERTAGKPPAASPPESDVQSPMSTGTTTSSYFSPISNSSSWTTTSSPNDQFKRPNSVVSAMSMSPPPQPPVPSVPLGEMDSMSIWNLVTELPAIPGKQTNPTSKPATELSSEIPVRKPSYQPYDPSKRVLPPEMPPDTVSSFTAPRPNPTAHRTTNSQDTTRYRAYTAPGAGAMYADGMIASAVSTPGDLLASSYNPNMNPGPSRAYSDGMILAPPSSTSSAQRPPLVGGEVQGRNTYPAPPRPVYSDGLILNQSTITHATPNPALRTMSDGLIHNPSAIPNSYPAPSSRPQSMSNPPQPSTYQPYRGGPPAIPYPQPPSISNASLPYPQSPNTSALSLPYQETGRAASPSPSFVSAISQDDEGEGDMNGRMSVSASVRRRARRGAALGSGG